MVRMGACRVPDRGSIPRRGGPKLLGSNYKLPNLEKYDIYDLYIL